MNENYCHITVTESSLYVIWFNSYVLISCLSPVAINGLIYSNFVVEVG